MNIRALNGIFVLIALLMVATAVRSKPHPIDWLALAAPLIALWAFWGSVRALLQKTGALKDNPESVETAAFLQLRRRIDFVVLMGLSAISAAISAGWEIGHTATR